MKNNDSLKQGVRQIAKGDKTTKLIVPNSLFDKIPITKDEESKYKWPKKVKPKK